MTNPAPSILPGLRFRQRFPLLALILERFVLSLVLLFAVSILIFGGLEALPGDFATTYLGQSATPQAVANIREDLGLNRPITTRYVEWLGNAVQGDFGTSWASKNSVSEQIGKRLGNSLFLAGFAAVISVPLAVGLGMLSVHFRNRLPDKIINVISLAAISLPEFFIGYLLILFFAVNLGMATFPATVYDSMSFVERLKAIALPTATLVLVVLAHMMRMTRAAILSVMSSAYMETAELKGLSAFRAIVKHAAPNALAPIINVIALNLAYLVVGVVVVEVVFVYPGMGQYMVDAVTVRDMPVVQACGLIFAAVYIFLNMTADILAIIANPRLRHPR
ncbi:MULTISPECIES: ABC transporter permease [Rhizobium]|jgi:peptide/nickel transport system permease protein|uniref:ABC transporter permease subunit n=1 Tax=Rhizobium leguminosarum TaxID=384 RepID=A0A6P0DEG4_RHILE|nr:MULTISPECIES: ABC transporter permease [Rhizobium]ASS59720.1 ABC transporter permease [Rhizobium leguminosarum bv. viciae]AVC45963.1 binding-protein-dependent transport system inner membrane component family protein [Rhizobium leguminosarum bv. viciae]MBB4330883.1 peptide/nickel transport system permease protein [Rhizobium leguminosarum]MBB4340519.1 peptide/nickel transport system permease protein [Rhizobium leguminosarum]MBB4356070.1 peptide/nickel transport system permease protein [Rhizob